MTTATARALAERMLSKERFFHTCCVARQAKLLAERFGEDADRAELAGYLHDIMKEQPDGVLLQMVESSDIIDVNDLKKCPKIWHAFAGGEYAEKRLGVDAGIADAIRYHSTGRAGMTPFEMVVFLADYTSDDRDFAGAEEVRLLAESSLEKAMTKALRDQISHLLKQEKHVDLNSVNAYNYLIETGR